jgi:hypothetical protein
MHARPRDALVSFAVAIACRPEPSTQTPAPSDETATALASATPAEAAQTPAPTLPLSGPVELENENHDTVPPCDATLARRVARLAFAAASPLPPEWARECDVDRAGCGTLPLEAKLPPTTCTITLHEQLLRVERPAADDTPRSLDAWADPEFVFVQEPHITRTSASRVDVRGKRVVIAGQTSHHRHEHGGDAARIGSATFIAHNPHARPLRLDVRGIEYLRNSECNLPQEVEARPKPAAGTPTELAPGQSEIVVRFATQAAYQVHCDRFATRVTFAVEGKRIAATAEHEVTRFEPLRR